MSLLGNKAELRNRSSLGCVRWKAVIYICNEWTRKPICYMNSLSRVLKARENACKQGRKENCGWGK